MKVRIVKCSNPNDWYSTRTGLEFEVVQSDAWADYYRVLGCEKLILKSDCEIIKEEKDAIKPDHYPKFPGGDVIDMIDFYGLNFQTGNTLKYLLRAGKKDPSKYMEDLQKASEYLNREIERIQNKS